MALTELTLVVKTGLIWSFKTAKVDGSKAVRQPSPA